ncbi:hypothetical protein QZH41_015921, partial [Actinostola sp. cb2023]
FFVLLLIVLSLEIAAGVLGAVYKNQAKEDVRTGLDKAIQHYNDTGYGLDKALDFLQHKLKCCGDDNYTDYFDSPYWKSHHHLPDSCFPSHEKYMHEHRYSKGCYDSLLSRFNDYLTYIIGIGIGFAILQLFGMVACCFVMCRNGEVSYVTLNGGTFV